MLLSQMTTHDGRRAVVVRNGTEAHEVEGVATTRELALACIEAGQGLAAHLQARRPGPAVDLAAALAEGRVLPPIDHPDPAHLLVTGTGLTHLGSAATRDAMHREGGKADTPDTDSMRMFRMGVEGGRPADGAVGVQPEWFYKGNGDIVAAPGAALNAPAFAQDGGEEPEIAGIYVIGADGTPFRFGFALANEFSDHVMERVNYLYLAHSKLRPCAIGPELLLGELPAEVRGTSRIRRGGRVVWEKPFLSGEANMCHSLENLERHHFKYLLFRRPGDLHAHFMGTSTLSFSDGFKTEPGDEFEIEAEGFGRPLRNRLEIVEIASVAPRALA